MAERVPTPITLAVAKTTERALEVARAGCVSAAALDDLAVQLAAVSRELYVLGSLVAALVGHEPEPQEIMAEPEQIVWYDTVRRMDDGRLAYILLSLACHDGDNALESFDAMPARWARHMLRIALVELLARFAPESARAGLLEFFGEHEDLTPAVDATLN